MKFREYRADGFPAGAKTTATIARNPSVAGMPGETAGTTRPGIAGTVTGEANAEAATTARVEQAFGPRNR
jgi:hypothetical protein